MKGTCKFMGQNSYLEKRPYRAKTSLSIRWLVDFMDLRFEQSFDDYWEQFGYEIGGPVCYAYVSWFSKLIDLYHQGMTDIAFVARDGWLLKQIYEKLPHQSKAKTHYIYAPRTINLQSQSDDGRSDYRKYLKTEDFCGGEIGVVDTVTMKFSSQRLIASAEIGNTHGFFWCVLDHPAKYKNNYSHSSFQREGCHVIRSWNMMEFIMTSPEPPILCLQEGEPIYRSITSSENLRRKVFSSIAQGVLSFIDDICQKGDFPEISNSDITKWVNDFLKNPGKEDILAFEPIRFSEREDHSDDIALDPFSKKKKVYLKILKDRIWFWSQKNKTVYTVIHFLKRTIKKGLVTLQSIGCDKYSGYGQEKLIDKLSQYDVVSFDVFDTLIFRPYEKPTDLFFELEKENGLFDFHDVRIQSEIDARSLSKKGHQEVDIQDIYEEVEKHYKFKKEEYVRREIDKEVSICYANPDFLDVCRLLSIKGVKMIAVSDMYLPAKVIRTILEKCGYTNINDIYVSCEYGAGKYDGSLQRVVHERIGLEKKIIHIGDNYGSDVKNSNRAGWTAILYQK